MNLKNKNIMITTTNKQKKITTKIIKINNYEIFDKRQLKQQDNKFSKNY